MTSFLAYCFAYVWLGHVQSRQAEGNLCRFLLHANCYRHQTLWRLVALGIFFPFGCHHTTQLLSGYTFVFSLSHASFIGLAGASHSTLSIYNF